MVVVEVANTSSTEAVEPWLTPLREAVETTQSKSVPQIAPLSITSVAEVELTRLLVALAMIPLMQALELTTLLVALVMTPLMQAVEQHTSSVTMAKYR